MISEKNENKRHCAKYIKNREQFCVFKQKQTISFTKYQVRCTKVTRKCYSKDAKGGNENEKALEKNIECINGRNGNGRKPYSMWGR